MLNKHYQKNPKKHVKGTKIFLKKKKNIVNIISIEINIFLKKKQRTIECMRNYYLAHKK